MMDRRNIFVQQVKNYLRAYDNIWKIKADQGDHYRTGFLLDDMIGGYPYFKEHYKTIAIELDPKTMH